MGLEQGLTTGRMAGGRGLSQVAGRQKLHRSFGLECQEGVKSNRQEVRLMTHDLGPHGRDQSWIQFFILLSKNQRNKE